MQTQRVYFILCIVVLCNINKGTFAEDGDKDSTTVAETNVSGTETVIVTTVPTITRTDETTPATTPADTSTAATTATATPVTATPTDDGAASNTLTATPTDDGATLTAALTDGTTAGAIETSPSGDNSTALPAVTWSSTELVSSGSPAETTSVGNTVPDVSTAPNVIEPDPGKSAAGLAVGVALALILVLVLSGGMLYFIIRKKNRKYEPLEEDLLVNFENPHAQDDAPGEVELSNRHGEAEDTQVAQFDTPPLVMY